MLTAIEFTTLTTLPLKALSWPLYLLYLLPIPWRFTAKRWRDGNRLLKGLNERSKINPFHYRSGLLQLCLSCICLSRSSLFCSSHAPLVDHSHSKCTFRLKTNVVLSSYLSTDKLLFSISSCVRSIPLFELSGWEKEMSSGHSYTSVPLSTVVRSACLSFSFFFHQFSLK